MKVKLEPIKSVDNEQILIQTKNPSVNLWYPMCITHIDSLWEGDRSEDCVYGRLLHGETIIGEMSIIPEVNQ